MIRVEEKDLLQGQTLLIVDSFLSQWSLCHNDMATNVYRVPCESGKDLSVSMTATVNVSLLPATCNHQRSIDNIIQVQIRSWRRIMFPEKPLVC